MTCYKLLLAASIASTILISCHIPEKPVSQQEALDFAKRIENSIKSGNEGFLDNVFDKNVFASRVLSAAKVHFSVTLNAEAKEAIEEAHLGKQINASIEKTGSYKLLHYYEKDGHQHLLFRMFSANAAINYHDFELTKTDQGVKAADVFVYLTGEELSKTIGEGLLAVNSKLADMDGDEKQKALQFTQINKYLQGGNPEEADRYYQQMPAVLRHQRLFQLLHLRIARQRDDSTYIAALYEYKSNFPNDPNLYLLMLDANVLQKKYPEALSAVNYLDSLVKKDPYLDFYRGALYKVMDEPAQAHLAFLRFHAVDPGFGKVTGELIDNYMAAGFPDSAAGLIREQQTLNNITPKQIEAIVKDYPTMRRYLK